MMRFAGVAFGFILVWEWYCKAVVFGVSGSWIEFDLGDGIGIG